MSNQEKFTTWSSKFKVHGSNSQTISLYPVRFSKHILFSYLVSFPFCLLVSLFVSLFDWFFVCLFFKNIYILIHIWLCGGGVIKNFSPGRFSKTGQLFFGRTIIRTFFVPFSPVWPLIFSLNLNESVIALAILKSAITPLSFKDSTILS